MSDEPERPWQPSATAHSRHIPDWLRCELRRRREPVRKLPAWAVDAVLDRSTMTEEPWDGKRP